MAHLLVGTNSIKGPGSRRAHPIPTDPGGADLFCFSPPSLHCTVAAACGRWEELPLFIRLSGRASAGMLLDRGADLSSPRFYASPDKKSAVQSADFLLLIAELCAERGC